MEETEQTQSYVDKLRESAKTHKSIVCMDLYPLIKAMPTYGDFRGRVRIFYENIFNQMTESNVFPGAFKINQTAYEIHNEPSRRNFYGYDAIADTIETIRERFPNMPIIMDSQKSFSEIHNNWEVDAVTVNPYKGYSPNIILIGDKNLGIYVSAITPRPGAKDFQQLCLSSNDSICEKLKDTLNRFEEKTLSKRELDDMMTMEIRPMMHRETVELYTMVAKKIIDWGKDNPNIGTILSTENYNDLRETTALLEPHHRPLLIEDNEGLSGSIKKNMSALYSTHHEIELMRINSSHELLYPWKVSENASQSWANEVVNGLKKLNKEIDYAQDEEKK
jgi:hypothetical protein